MKEDYLWDKTGKDSEIEKLENSLQAFRSTNTTPPALPAKTFAFDKGFVPTKTARRSFQFAFAAFASLALVIISIGVFQIVRTDDQDLAQNSAEQMSNKTIVEKPISVPEESKEISEPTITKAKFTAKRQIKRRVVKDKKQVPTKISDNKTIAKDIKPKVVKPEQKSETVILTEEEQYAYDQLMTALAITSSKLKLVKDKVQGLE